MEDTVEDSIEKYSKKNKALSRELKVESNQDLKNYVNSVLENQSKHYRETNQNLENIKNQQREVDVILIKEEPKIDYDFTPTKPRLRESDEYMFNDL